MSKNILSAILLFMVVIKCNSQIVYVNQTATGLNNGSSWKNAYTDLSQAINNTVGGHIWVAKGTYIPTTDLNGKIPNNIRLNTFKLKPNVAIYGGFNGTETDLGQRNWTSNPTVLSGEVGTPNDYTDNLMHVISSEYVSLGLNTILDGLTIKSGYARIEGGSAQGGGIYVNGGDFKMKNCIVEENTAQGDGGGLYVFNSDPIIENCIFRNNKAIEGGAMYLSYSEAIVDNCEIYSNGLNNSPTAGWSALSGGGIYIGSYSSPKISNNSITNNYAKDKGGGLLNNSNYEVIFNNNIVSKNESGDGGGLFLEWTTYCFNNLIHDNLSKSRGGGIYMDYDSNESQIINNTIIRNSAGTRGGGLYIEGANPNVINSILYSNTSPIGAQIGAINYNGNWAPDFRYCDIQGGLTSVSTYGNAIVYQDNLDVNPLFADVANNNFRLQGGSTLINAGTSNPSIVSTRWPGVNGKIIDFPTTDLNGFQRIVDTIDIGAYEFVSPLGIPTEQKFGFIIYPNPSEGIFNISLNTNYDSLSVFDMQGKELYHKFNGSGTTSVDLTSYPSGLYFICLFQNNKRHFSKIIKTN